jgi:hypothetical protein
MLVLFRICQAYRKSFKPPIHPPLGDIRVLSNLDDCIEGILAVCTTFLLQYLGLPLLLWCLNKVDFQYLEDKCAWKLPTWNGKFITMAGRTSL